MTKHQRTPSSYDANATIPECLTDQFIKRIQSLNGSNSKVSYLQSEFLAKFVSTNTAPDEVRRNTAIFKWLLTERNNAASNVRLLNMCEEYRILPHVTYARFVDKCRSIIATTIGDVPPWEAFLGSFSGGASTSRNRTESLPAQKYLGEADVTSSALVYFQDLLEDIPAWAGFGESLTYRVVPGNVLFTVPKNATIDRCACKEPDINMFLQKGLGKEISRCLRRVGINLNDQSKNRDLAKLGSETGSLATIDLSSASDSICTQLVHELLPTIWVSSLEALRSPVTIIDGEEHVNEMFSSMGNGFTFELESLLFYSIARTVAYFEGVSGIISVYGDDIICPVEVADSLIWVLGVFGFETNVKKSFSSGPFRESCGGHFYNGYDITPFYLRKPVKRLTDLIHLANSLRDWADRCAMGICDIEIFPIWEELVTHIPKSLWGGRDLASKVQLVSPDYPRFKLEPRVRKRRFEDGAYLHWLNSTWSRFDPLGGDVEISTVREAERKFRLRPLNATWVRENASKEGVETSSVSEVVQKYRLRPAAKADVSPLSSFFLEELAIPSTLV